jgi:hypothetical protein
MANGYNITNRALCMKRPGRPEELDFRTKLRVSTVMVVLPLMIPHPKEPRSTVRFVSHAHSDIEDMAFYKQLRTYNTWNGMRLQRHPSGFENK